MLGWDWCHELFSSHTLLLDGGLATGLEKRGHDLSHPLWSAKVLLQDPNAIKQVHLDYFLAGANIAITASYQASIAGFKQHMNAQAPVAVKLIKQSVKLAQDARDLAYAAGLEPEERPLLIAGSVGPYGAYLANGSEYTGDYGLSSDYKESKNTLQAFHEDRLTALIDADVDFILLETMPNFHEIRALRNWLQYRPGSEMVVALSVTLKDATHISDGTPVEDVIRLIDYDGTPFVAFGANCVPPDLIPGFLEHARQHTDMVLMAYPNSGEVYDATSKTWSGNVSADNFAEVVDQQWLQNGASIIGGCCRTTPAYIRSLVPIVNAYTAGRVDAAVPQEKAIINQRG